ncbi:hypothetical protein IJ541_09560 [bacterium]|nr:hypothetical protein [bacterium]
MSIVINTDLEYLRARLNIPQARMEEYSNKTVEEILEAEAAQGNQAAIQLAADMFTDVNQLIELFQLADPENKLVIMSQMTSSQLEKLVPMLETNDLIQGLNYFTQDSLLKLLKDIPKEELVKTVFQMFSETQIIEYMPEKELDKLLTGTDMDKDLLLQSLKFIPEMYLQQIVESVTGQEANGNSTELVNQIGQFGDMDYKNAITNLQPAQKRQLTFIITNQENKLYEKFDTDAYTHIIARERNKDEMVKSMSVIKPEYLQKMINQLPQDLLSVVTTQIDTEKFADALINKFPELLAQFVAG